MPKNTGFEYQATIKGRVIPVAWSSSNQVTRVSIWTANDTEFIVEDNAIANELNEMVREEVVATGQVFALDGDKRLTLDTWKPVAMADEMMAGEQAGSAA